MPATWIGSAPISPAKSRKRQPRRSRHPRRSSFKRGTRQVRKSSRFTAKAAKTACAPVRRPSHRSCFTLTAKRPKRFSRTRRRISALIGIGILKLIVSRGCHREKSAFKLKAGFLTLWNKGYFGVITAGGAPFASFLASKGLNGIGAIKDALKRAGNEKGPS